MRVLDVLKTYEISGINQTARTGRISRAEEKKDMLALSNTAKDYQNVRKALSGVPDIRNEKVDFIKSKIDTDSYDVKASDVAHKIISNYWQ